MTTDLCRFWTDEAAEALGCVGPDGPFHLTWSEILQAIRALRQERDELLATVEASGHAIVSVRNGRNGESQLPSGRNQPDTD